MSGHLTTLRSPAADWGTIEREGSLQFAAQLIRDHHERLSGGVDVAVVACPVVDLDEWRKGKS
jgi:hypothetical protein